MIEIDNAVVDKNLDENFLKKLGNLNLWYFTYNNCLKVKLNYML
jgi:hypothetical protein